VPFDWPVVYVPTIDVSLTEQQSLVAAVEDSVFSAHMLPVFSGQLVLHQPALLQAFLFLRDHVVDNRGTCVREPASHKLHDFFAAEAPVQMFWQ